MSGYLDVVQSPRHISSADEKVFSLDTTEYGGTPTDISVTAVNLSTGYDVTSQVLSGSATANGDAIILPTIANLIPRNEYAIDILFTSAGQTQKVRLHLIVEF